GQIKMDGDRALVESIQKRQQQIIVTLSKVGTKAYQVEQLFEALSATKMKATLGVEKDKMVIKLMIDKKMDEAVWLREISLFIKALREQKYKE
ncbi:MAG: hypothetical protein E6540_09350, partial [Enterococcus sp.]|nr:hypothetical protein [Enterococcus sp.]